MLGEKLVPVPLVPPQISHGLSQDRMWGTVLRGPGVIRLDFI